MANNQFHPMWKKPKPSGDEDGYSELVIVYELDEETKEVIDSDLAFYMFEEESWQVMGDFSILLHCWTEIPSPTEFMQDKNWKPMTHKGYN